MDSIRRHLTFANVCAALALFVALGGLATAKDKKDDKLPKNSVGTKQLKDDAVRPPDIKDGAITDQKIPPSAITGDKIKDGSVTDPKIGDGAISDKKVQDGSLSEGKLTPADRPYWAQVGSAGEMQSQSGGITSHRITDGVYWVEFPISMSGHGLTANRSSRDPDIQSTDVSVTLTRCGGGPDADDCPADHNRPSVVEVRTDSASVAGLNDAGFMLSATP